jgi:hypothetical protein
MHYCFSSVTMSCLDYCYVMLLPRLLAMYLSSVHRYRISCVSITVSIVWVVMLICLVSNWLVYFLLYDCWISSMLSCLDIICLACLLLHV